MTPQEAIIDKTNAHLSNVAQCCVGLLSDDMIPRDRLLACIRTGQREWARRAHCRLAPRSHPYRGDKPQHGGRCLSRQVGDDVTIPTLTAEDLIREYAATLAALRVLVWRTVGRDKTAEEVERAEALTAEIDRLSRLLWPRAKA